jgi:hypothetical protein
MKTALLSLLAVVLMAGSGVAQVDTTSREWFGLQNLTEYLGLKPNDISYRSDYTEPDSLRLKKVAELMGSPLGMIGYATALRQAHVKGQPEILAGILFADLAGEYQTGRRGAYRPHVEELEQNYNLFYIEATLNQMLSRVATFIDVIFPRSTEVSLAPLSPDERKFLTNEFKEIITMSEDEEFLSVEAMDSLEKVDERNTEAFMKFAYRIDKDPVCAAGLDCLRNLLLDVNMLRGTLRSDPEAAARMIKGIGYLPAGMNAESYLGKQPGWRIGGLGNDYYSGDFKFILDLGGDDVYDLSYDPANPHGVIIIDLSGDDVYRAQTDYALGSGCLSVGLLMDMAGNDTYKARSFGLGSGYFGFGLLYDAEGDDRYDGDTHVEGAGTFGLGLLIDEGGRDVYNAAVYSQGFGFVQGCGVIYELGGSDSYYAGGKYKDVLRYEDHYLSLSQGFGYGLRPWMSGGIGAIVDITGNDNYYSDIFAQGCSYWWSLGVLYDSSGLDNYQCFQYGQGAATHMSQGILIDDYGNDVYFGKGLMQGCGHDYSCGLILDRHGDDTYTCYDLSQGAGSANGAGVLIDNEGNDRYFCKNAANTQGYGNPRRDFGSIGLFIDLSGEDQYSGNGRDDSYWKTKSQWGGGMDIDSRKPDSTEVSQ